MSTVHALESQREQARQDRARHPLSAPRKGVTPSLRWDETRECWTIVPIASEEPQRGAVRPLSPEAGFTQPEPEPSADALTAPPGKKDTKPERMSWIPSEALWELSRVYGYGAERHADPHQYLHGYPWSHSIDAAQRHLTRWTNGERLDESGYSHLMHAAWHLFALYMFEQHGTGDDDRLSTTHVRRPHTIERGRQ